jgi:Zn-dependent protease
MLPLENDLYTPIISRYLRIEDKTWGDEKKGYIIRYSGQLYNLDSAQTYDQLAEALRPQNITPLFRLEGNKHVILLQNGIIQPKPSKVWANILFFILTMISVTFTGAVFSSGDIPTNISGWFNFLRGGLPFSIALLTILLFHEFGHYLVGRYHKTAVTLPFFIPLPYPISIFGTFGAFIQMKEPPKNKRTLLDIGIAGPLAGLIVAIPILLYGLYLSPVDKLPIQFPVGQILEGNSILYLLLKFIAKGQLLPQPFIGSAISSLVLHFP